MFDDLLSKADKELEKYRRLGTPEEIEKCLDVSFIMLDIIKESNDLKYELKKRCKDKQIAF